MRISIGSESNTKMNDEPLAKLIVLEDLISAEGEVRG
jgi:hypothetical protein